MKRTVRLFEPGDLDDLMACWESANRIAHPFLPEEFVAQERFNIPNVYMPNAETWVLVEDEKVIGFLALVGNEVAGLFVNPEFHRSGAGGLLMKKARELHDVLEVEVFEANSIGRAFYEKTGFKLMNQSVHEATGNELLRLRLDSNS